MVDVSNYYYPGQTSLPAAEAAQTPANSAANRALLYAHVRGLDQTTKLAPLGAFSTALGAVSQAGYHDALGAGIYHDMRIHEPDFGSGGMPSQLAAGAGLPATHIAPAPAPILTASNRPNAMPGFGMSPAGFSGFAGPAQMVAAHPVQAPVPAGPRPDMTRYLAQQSGMTAPEFTNPVGSLSAQRPDMFKHAFAHEEMLADGQMGVPSAQVPAAAAPAPAPTPVTPAPAAPAAGASSSLLSPQPVTLTPPPTPAAPQAPIAPPTDWQARAQGNGKPGYSTGTSRVPGKGSPKVDSVKANLAPDEAVLNAGAADHIGRPVIDALNAIGMAKMGMVPASTMDDRAQVQQAAQTTKGPDSSSTKDDRAQNPGFAKGTAKVGKGMPPGKAPDISQIDPKLLAMALQMGQGGAQGAPAGPPQGAGMM
jgi:hypothetical protein